MGKTSRRLTTTSERIPRLEPDSAAGVSVEANPRVGGQMKTQSNPRLVKRLETIIHIDLFPGGHSGIL
jgi:hypothetical protein